MTFPPVSTALRRFVVLCAGRTGSNWFCGLLNSHPQVLCHHELFNPRESYFAHGYRDGEMGLAWSPEQRDAAPLAYLDAIWSRSFGCDAVGFKINHGQTPTLRDELIRDRTIRKVVLERRNILRAYVSRLRAQATGAWSMRSYDGVRVKVELEPWRRFLSEYRGTYARIRTMLGETGQEWASVAYEDLVSRRAVGDVLRFLEVSDEESTLESFTQRQSHDRLDEVITNYDEVRRELAGTDDESMLE